MKRADSLLIRRFISNVKAKCITGDEHTGSYVLQEIVEALQAIQEGADTDTALQIKRKAGQPADSMNFGLACWIHEQRKDNQKWAVIERMGNEMLDELDREAISMARMKQIYKQNLDAVKTRENKIRIARNSE